jgi:hypothetical protein
MRISHLIRYAKVEKMKKGYNDFQHKLYLGHTQWDELQREVYDLKICPPGWLVEHQKFDNMRIHLVMEDDHLEVY